MSWRTTCYCDVCGKPKGEANHWLMVDVRVRGWSPRFAAWDNDDAHNHGAVCGQDCMQRVLSDWLRDNHDN